MKALFAALATCLALSSPALALSFTTIGAPSPLVLPADHTGVDYGIGAGSLVFEQTAPGDALGIDGPAIVTAEFVGFEARYNNRFDLGPISFTNDGSAIGDTGAAAFGAGLLPFAFLSDSIAAITNGSGTLGAASIAFSILTGQSALLLFNDSSIVDADFDDMKILLTLADPSEVPLPAALPLLGGAIAFAGYWARRKNRKAA